MQDIRREPRAQFQSDPELPVMELKAPVNKQLRLIKIIAIALALIALCGYLAYLFTKAFDIGKNPHHNESQNAKKIQFYDMDEILVNLMPSASQKRYIKIKISLKLSNDLDYNNVESHSREIKDSFIAFLREIRAEDLDGSGAIIRLKEELMKRVDKIMHPIEINDMLFTEIVVD